MSELPTPPAGFKIVGQQDLVSEIPDGWTVVEDRPAPPAGFVLKEEPAVDDKSYQSVILPTRIDEKGGMHWAVPGMVQGMWDALTLPGEVAAGKVDVNSPEGFDRAMGLATSLVGGRVPSLARAVAVDEAGKTIPRAVRKAVERDQVPFTEVGTRMKEIGPDAVIADLGPNTRDLTAAVAARPSAGQRTVVDALTERRDAAPARVTSALDEILGIAPVPSKVHAEIKTNQRTLGPLYDQALAAAQPVDTSFIAGNLDNVIPELRGPAQSALQSVRSMLNETGTSDLDNRATTLFQVRRAVDGMMDGELDGNVKRVLGDVRRQVDDVLQRSVPGIKEVEARYSELKGQRDALGRGQTVLGSGRDDPRPIEIAEEVATGAQPGGFIVGPSAVSHRLRQGARAEIDRLVGTNLNDRAALNSMMKGNSDWNHDRLVSLFGPERTDRLYKLLEHERTMAATESKAPDGSKTASVQAAQKSLDPASARPSVVRSMLDLKPGTAAASAVDMFIGGLREQMANKRNLDVARHLVSSGPWKSVAEPLLPISARVGAIMSGAQEK
jgi:hypothetical protein